MGCEVSADQSLGFDSLKRLQLSSERVLSHMIEIYLSELSVTNDRSALPDDGYANRITADIPIDAEYGLR